MQLLEWGHPEIGVRLELVIQPGGSGFLRSDAQEIGARFAGATVILIFAVVGFESPVPMHCEISSIYAVESKIARTPLPHS